MSMHCKIVFKVSEAELLADGEEALVMERKERSVLRCRDAASIGVGGLDTNGREVSEVYGI